MSKTLTVLLLVLASFAPCLQSQAQSARSAEAFATLVADAITGKVLRSTNPTKKLQIGSITKVATAMVVLDWAERTHVDIGTMATIPESAVAVGSTNPIGFHAGDQVSLRDLLYAAMLQSDNIAAATLAIHVGSTLPHGAADATAEELFVAQMNALARKLGMKRTMFLNPHGLDNAERPYSTAQDLLALTSYAMNRSAFRFYVSQKERKITVHLSGGQTAEYNLVNTNELLGTNAVDGVKTGKTARAGECVVISAARAPESVKNADGSVTVTPRRLIVIVLGAQDRFGLAAQLLNDGWQRYDEWVAAGRPMEKKG